MDIRNHNRDAWNNYVKRGNQWTKAVSPYEITRAKKGDWEIVLTPTKPVPASWFPDFQGAGSIVFGQRWWTAGPHFSCGWWLGDHAG